MSTPDPNDQQLQLGFPMPPADDDRDATPQLVRGSGQSQPAPPSLPPPSGPPRQAAGGRHVLAQPGSRAVPPSLATGHVAQAPGPPVPGIPAPPPAQNPTAPGVAMGPRLRRLHADYERLMTAFSGHPHIRVEAAAPQPPDRYRVVYTVPGLHMTAGNAITRVGQHVVDVQLPSGYPRDKPYCVTSAPVFHPNFGNYVCIADFWSPGQALADVIVQIGDMLQYKLYNTRSPLNAVAAKWAVENIASLPLSNIELLPLEPEIRLGATTQRTQPDDGASP